MNIFILRHGEAVEPGTAGYPDDADRPLTTEGKAKLRIIARAIDLLDLKFEIAFSSPYKRARQTAEIVTETLNLPTRLTLLDELTPGANPAGLVELLNSQKTHSASMLLVGHEPFLSGLISWLISGHTNLPIQMKKGGLAKVVNKSARIDPHSVLKWLLTPKQLAQIGRGDG